ncbi:NAD(P)/FAD-dependent oxidoreductase [Marimonas arenosa]|uniref:FAD-binding oxidoreductase n=1 Tax=Marimonas arenosa TaxID=1795305 RepID=A0AAE4B3T5_9RHOB|nr:FAD-dependent oxidoreductase [Marimonas arenosa]MDQ2089542.1 FAD-binding oxidoreductase [Marimonas arenosa]
MKRIFPDHAYSDDRIAGCYWSETVPDLTLKRPPPEGDHHAGVAIIGAGFTGLSAALRLVQAGISVAVVDARFPGWGASGRNGGFCCLGGSKLDDAAIDKRFGRDARLEWRRAEKAAVELVARLLREHSIEAETHSEGETQLAHKPSAARFEEAIATCEQNFGVTPQVLSVDDLAEQGMGGPFYGGLTTPIGFGLNPRKYLAGLMKAAESAGAVVFGDAPVSEMTRQGGRWRLSSQAGSVTADTVILATNGYSSEDVPEWMAARYMPAQSSVIVTRPMSEAELEAQGWTSDQAAYDSRTLLHYFRLMPDRRFLFGMRGGLGSSPASEAAIRRLIRRDFEAMFPAWAGVETPYFWSGMVCLSANLVPYCGPVRGMPGVFAGYAYHGNGVAMGSYTGALLADLVQGRDPGGALPEVMRQTPERFFLGRRRRALMYAAYTGFWLRDRFG